MNVIGASNPAARVVCQPERRLQVARQDDQAVRQLEGVGRRGRHQDRDPIGQGRGQSSLVLAQLEGFAMGAAPGGQTIDQGQGRGEGGALPTRRS